MRRSWAGTATFGPEHAAVWVASGARLVGGCCRVGPARDQAAGPVSARLAGWGLGVRLVAVSTQTPSAMTASTSRHHQPALHQAQWDRLPPRCAGDRRQQQRAHDRGEPGQRRHAEPPRDPSRDRLIRGAATPRRRVSSSTATGRQRNATMLADPVNLPVGARPDGPVVLGEQHDDRQRGRPGNAQPHPDGAGSASPARTMRRQHRERPDAPAPARPG